MYIFCKDKNEPEMKEMFNEAETLKIHAAVFYAEESSLICSLEKQYADIKLLNPKYAKRASYDKEPLQINNLHNQLRRNTKLTFKFYVGIIYLFKI